MRIRIKRKHIWYRIETFAGLLIKAFDNYDSAKEYWDLVRPVAKHCKTAAELRIALLNEKLY